MAAFGRLKRAWDWFGHGTRAWTLYQLLLAWQPWAAGLVMFLTTTAVGRLLPEALLFAFVAFCLMSVTQLVREKRRVVALDAGKIGSPLVTVTSSRRRSEYEIQRKMEAADQALTLLKDVRDTADFVHEIKHSAITHFSHRDSAQVRIFDLGRCRNETISLGDRVRAFCDETCHYPDLARCLQPLLGTISNVTVATEHFRTAYNNLTQVMQFSRDTADSGVFGSQIQPFLGELDAPLSHLEDQRRQARDAVVAIRQEIAR
jgi:hypothetical protein